MNTGFEPDDFEPLASAPIPGPCKRLRPPREGSERELIGPQELSAAIAKTREYVHQLNHRGKLPIEDMRISGVPIWYRATLTAAGILPGRAEKGNRA